MENSKEKPSIIKIIVTTATLVTILGAAIAFFIDYGKKQSDYENHKKQLKYITFDDNKMKQDTKELLDIEFHPVKVYQQNDTVKKYQKILNSQLERTDTVLELLYGEIQKDRIQRKDKEKSDSLKNIKVEGNRVKRTKVQENILDELELIKLEQRKIKRRLDTVN